MRKLLLATPVLAAIALLAQVPGPGPWQPADLIQPQDLAARMKSRAKQPAIFYVGFPVLYRNARITGAKFVGTASQPAGLAELRKTLAALPKDADIVLYCGCCPWEHCPNVRPAMQLIKQLGYRKVRLLVLETNLSKDWIQKGYPTEKPGQPQGN
jgi:thiosulfate/3-mercaptopyruvate sulfurtransferase